MDDFELPDHLINKNIINVWDDVPSDELSTHIMRLTCLHLKTMNDEQRRTVIDGWNKALGIRPFISERI